MIRHFARHDSAICRAYEAPKRLIERAQAGGAEQQDEMEIGQPYG